MEEITKDHPVLLNRAPTLHKLSIQAFYPVLIEGSAIRLHPAVCSGFNADFDGDQMAVHVPLSTKAIEEAKTLMLPSNNLLKPADGSPVATPSSKEIALGAYYLTSDDVRLPTYNTIFGDRDEAIFANQTGKLEIRQKIKVMMGGKLVETTVGRILFNEVLPENFDYVNEAATSSVIKSLFVKAYSTVSKERVVQMVDDIKDLRIFWRYNFQEFPFGIFDAKVFPGKGKVLAEADEKVAGIEENFDQGLITQEEKRRLTQEVWIDTSEDLADKTWDLLEVQTQFVLLLMQKSDALSAIG